MIDHLAYPQKNNGRMYDKNLKIMNHLGYPVKRKKVYKHIQISPFSSILKILHSDQKILSRISKIDG